jgi:uncharacterized membrane protein YoaK (UPF0700 family)
MDQDKSSNPATDLDFNREETLAIAALLALAGGYIDAYSWITHRVFANAQTANMLFLWISAMEGEWARALHYLPSLTAFVIGVIMACWLRRLVGARAAPISLLVEIIFLIVVAILHNRTPGVAGTLGISLVAAMQAASFPRVEAWSYSSVMATTNLVGQSKASSTLLQVVLIRVPSDAPWFSGRSWRPSVSVLRWARI